MKPTTRNGPSMSRRRPTWGMFLASVLGLNAAGVAAAGDVVISQVYGGGGNSGATLRNDFVELFNRSAQPVDLAGWSLQYASASGSTWNNKTLLAGVIAPGQYYLVQQAQGAGGSVDLNAPDILGSIAMSATNGKLALVSASADITTGTSCPSGQEIVDFVGYGTANCSEVSPAPAPSNTNAILRLINGSRDTDNNSQDFATGAPTPRNSTTTSAVLSLTTTDSLASELGATAASFLITRVGGNTALALNVQVAVGGTALNGSDYLPALPTTVVIPPNQLSTLLVLNADNDALPEGTETATLTLLPGAGYVIGTAEAAVVTVADDDLADTSPVILATTPADGATNIALGAPVSITFSEQVDIAPGSVRVECPGGTLVASNAGLLSNRRTVSLQPTVVWPANTTCAVQVLASGVNDVDDTDPPAGPAADFIAAFHTTASACSAPDTPIGQIQGSGASAALTGTRTVQGVVVADYEGPDPALRGFYLQNLDATSDGDPATSDGIFIFNQNNDNVRPGQVVQVTGTVSEYGFASTGGTQTQISAQLVEPCGQTGSIVARDLALPLAAVDEFERYEGMLVRFPQTLHVSEHFQLGRYGQVLLSGGGRLAQPTSMALPGAAALALAAANARNQIVLDDATQAQNPDPVRFARSGQALSAANTLRGGDTIAGARGVLTQTDATAAGNVPASSDPVRYRLRPLNTLDEQPPLFLAANPRPATAAPLAGSTLRIAGSNLLNYFNTFGTTACSNGVGGSVAECRGAEDVIEFERQWTKTVQALLGAQADVIAVNEIENDGYGAGSAIRHLVDRLNAASAPGTYAFIDADAGTGQLNALGSDAIKVGLLYRTARVTPTGVTAVANTGAFGQFSTGAGLIQRNRPALAQAFIEQGTAARFVVVANHLKSKGSACADNLAPVGPDPDAGDGQGNCNLTRRAAAEQLATWLATDPTGAGATNVLIMGDLNAYAQEDPIAALRGAGYVDLVARQYGSGAYSYVFDGQWGYLDHALATPALAAQVTALEEWHINADEPVVLDYNTNFKSAAQIAGLYAPDAFRTSDHDVVIVGLALDSDVDSLADSREDMLGTDPLDADSDDDGLADGVEDADRDGIRDADETQATIADSDGDGLADGLEAGVVTGVLDPDGAGPLLGTAPAGFVADADPGTTTDPLAADTDGDGVDDGVEDSNRNGARDAGESDPLLADAGPVTHAVPAWPAWANVLCCAVLALLASVMRRQSRRHIPATRRS